MARSTLAVQKQES